MLSPKDLRAILQQRRSLTERVLQECTAILREIGYYPTPLRSTTAKRISKGLIVRPSPPVGTYTCDKCERVFRYFMHLGRHKQIAHPTPPAKNPGPTKEKTRP